MLSIGELEGVETWLDLAEDQLNTNADVDEETSANRSALEDEELRRLPAMVSLYRAAMALSRSDVAGTVVNAHKALDSAADDDHLSRAAAAGLLGLAYWASGDLDKALASYTNSITGLHKAGHTADTLGITIASASIQITQGRLTDALATYERALQLAPPRDGGVLRGTADMHVGISEVLLERSDLTGAARSLAYSQELGEHAGLPQNRYRSRVAQARLRAADGDLPAALALLDDAERVYVSDFFPNIRPIAALRARMQAGHGQVSDAQVWARTSGLSVDDDLYYMREFEHITLAAILLAANTGADATTEIAAIGRFLSRLAEAAEAGRRFGSLIEIRVLESMCHQSLGEEDQAVEALQQALTLAEPEGYVRVFRDAGPQLTSLLTRMVKHPTMIDYVKRLLASTPQVERRPATSSGLIEPLSDRELDVLRLLATDLEGPEIARQLFVSLNTVRTHTRRIYTKLGVNSRRAAVRRAAEMNLLVEPPRR
jgi:LuxR family maltose regulon positive regulatory protein